MRLRNIKNAKEIIDNSKYIIKNPENIKGNWSKEFNNTNPIYIEIGMGKGNFIMNNALKYPNINFIGIEMQDSVISRAAKKINELDIKNLRLIRIDARLLDEIFDYEIDLIYLNFSDPWPKNRNSKRRLTHERFLKVYDKIFRKDKKIFFKTDNDSLFEFSIESFSNYGYKLKNISLDLHNSDYKDNIMTEYEEKFSEKGVKIKRVEAYKDK